MVAGRIDRLSETIELEIGKPGFEALTSDLIPLLSSCRWHESAMARILRPRRLRGASLWQLGQAHRVERAPLGRVAIIATWNYPVQLLGIQLVQAVAGGNDVVVKPSERTPETQRLLVQMAIDARPPTRVEVVDAARETGARLLAAERFDHVVFTGSTEVGIEVARALAPSLTPSTLELSGCDSVLVLDDADVDLAVRAIWYGVTLNGGRTCMAPRRVLYDRSIGARMLDRLAGLCGERALRLDRDAGPVADAGVDELVRGAVEGGGRVLIADSTPVIVCDPPRTSPLAQGEHFGGALAVIVCDGLDDMLAVHQASPKHLATSVFTRHPQRLRDLPARLGSTTVLFNDVIIPTAHPAASIGGLGASGWGLSRGEAGLLSMTRPIYISRTSALVRTPLETPSVSVQRSMSSFVKTWYGGR